jgi:hypothetical protein
MEEEIMLSLYDFLGKAAGTELGAEIYKESQNKNVKTKVKTREISNKAYTGKVMLYPKSFLEEYFNKTKTNGINQVI